MSSDTRTFYIAAESSAGTTLSCWDLNGTLNWGYVIPGSWVFDMSLSPDETYLAITQYSSSKMYIMDTNSLTLTSLSTGISYPE